MHTFLVATYNAGYQCFTMMTKTSTMDQQLPHSPTGITLPYILFQSSSHPQPVKCYQWWPPDNLHWQQVPWD